MNKYYFTILSFIFLSLLIGCKDEEEDLVYIYDNDKVIPELPIQIDYFSVEDEDVLVRSEFYFYNDKNCIKKRRIVDYIENPKLIKETVYSYTYGYQIDSIREYHYIAEISNSPIIPEVKDIYTPWISLNKLNNKEDPESGYIYSSVTKARYSAAVDSIYYFTKRSDRNEIIVTASILDTSYLNKNNNYNIIEMRDGLFKGYDFNTGDIKVEWDDLRNVFTHDSAGNILNVKFENNNIVTRSVDYRYDNLLEAKHPFSMIGGIKSSVAYILGGLTAAYNNPVFIKDSKTGQVTNEYYITYDYNGTQVPFDATFYDKNNLEKYKYKIVYEQRD